MERATILGGDEASLKKGAVIAQAVCFARDLGNHPGNVATPTRLAEEARRIGEVGEKEVKVYDREEIVEKEQHFLSQGGRFITFVPTVGIVD